MKRRSFIVGSSASIGFLASSAPSLSQEFEPTLYYSNLTNDHRRRQARLLSSGGSIAVFGDSNTAGTSWAEIALAENYGIAGDTLAGLIHRLRDGYSSIATC